MSSKRFLPRGLGGLQAPGRLRPATLLLLGVLAIGASAHAQQYSVTEIPPAPGETGAPVATASNASGVVVGVLSPVSSHSPVPGNGDPSFNWPEGGTGAHAFQYFSGVTTDLGSSLPNFCGAGSSQLALAINAGGQITGVSACALTGAQSAFSGSATGGFRAIPQLAGTLAMWGQGINASGQVVGTFLLASSSGSGCGNTYHTFLYDPGTDATRDLGTFFGCSSHGEAINDSGQIAGTVSVANEPHAYIYTNGAAVDIGSIATCANGAIVPSYALAINAAGQVTGTAWNGCGGNGPDAFIYDSGTGTIRDLGRLGQGGSQGNAIDSGGRVVGATYTSSNTAVHAFLYADGSMVDLNSQIAAADAAKYILVDAVAINDNGQIVVQSTKTATGQPVTVVLTPVASVPNVVGDTQAAATNALTTAGFVLGTLMQQASTTAAPGIVISEDPVAGSSWPSGSPVNLSVSTGVTVPDVVGVSLAVATNTLTAAGLSAGSITQQFSRTVAQGVVIAQSPAAGSSVAGGTATNLVISAGAAPVQVPDILGDTQAAAAAALAGANLALGTVTQQASDTVPAGEVLDQSPAGGDSVAVGSMVSVILSSGAPRVSFALAGAPGFSYNGSGWTVAIAVENNGNVPADTELDSLSLNGIPPLTAPPFVMAGLAPGSARTIVVTFPRTVTSGTLKLSGSYSAGTLSGSWSLGARVSVPAVQ
jgi:probable HAF family extracellular repeat protein